MTVPAAPVKAVENGIEAAPPAPDTVVVIRAPTVPGTVGVAPFTLAYHLTVCPTAGVVTANVGIAERTVPKHTLFTAAVVGAAGWPTTVILVRLYSTGAKPWSFLLHPFQNLVVTINVSPI